MIEAIKNVAAVVGCISGCIGLLTVISKTIREQIVHIISSKSKENETIQKLDLVVSKIESIEKDVSELKSDVKLLDGRMDKIEKNVSDNESERLKSELFTCGNRCRRGIYLHQDEFEHMRQVYDRYANVLHKNHDGTREWEFIYEYYNEQELHNNTR